jgi:hypothetical protein
MPDTITTYQKPRSKAPIVAGGGLAGGLAIAAFLHLFSPSNADFATEKQETAAERAALSERVVIVELETEALDSLPGEVSKIKIDVRQIATDVAWIKKAIENGG